MTDMLDDQLWDWTELKNERRWTGLLVGNGFSQNLWQRFGYDSLFDTACACERAQLNAGDISLFEKFRTTNFEFVLSALTTARLVAEALEQPTDPLTERENSIRQALIHAVHSVHVPWKLFPSDNLRRINSALLEYGSIYTTNYDLSLYWSIMSDNRKFKDFFWSRVSPKFDILNTDVRENGRKIYFLHGGLHLYRELNGEILKRIAGAKNNLLDLFATSYGNAVPLFIAEGTSQEKLAAIARSDYLSFAYSSLRQDGEPLVVFGHSLGESDKHIVNAIRSHPDRPVAISLLADGNVRQRKAALIDTMPNINLSFYDAATHPLGANDLRIVEPV